MMKTGAIDAGVSNVIRLLGGKEILLIPVLMILFSLGGTSFGMWEETMAFYPLLIPVFVSAGYDPLVGIAQEHHRKKSQRHLPAKGERGDLSPGRANKFMAESGCQGFFRMAAHLGGVGHHVPDGHRVKEERLPIRCFTGGSAPWRGRARWPSSCWCISFISRCRY